MASEESTAPGDNAPEVSAPAAGAIAADDVREALEKLYEDIPLAQTSLAARLSGLLGPGDLAERGERLRRELLSGMTALQPARREPFGSRAGRSYDVLSLRHIEDMSVERTAAELGLVKRQVYRDLRRAYEELASLLTAHSTAATTAPTGTTAAPVGDGTATLREELSRLRSSPKRLDPREALESALEAALPLATRLGVAVQQDLPPDLPAITADEGVLHQMLVQILSLSAQNAASGRIRLTARQDDGDVVFEFAFDAAPGQPLHHEDRVGSLAQLAQAQNMLWRTERPPDGPVLLSISLKAVQPRAVLVIEDNEGAIEMYRRYLARSDEWQVVGAADSRLGLDLAARLKPSVILLDIMMPRWDGWRVLQLLRSQPETAAIPVVVCSVFDDPELAQALGANACLKKPLSQLELVAALRRATA